MPLLVDYDVDPSDANRILETVRSILQGRLNSTGGPQNLIGWRYFSALAKLDADGELRFAQMLRSLLTGDGDSPDRAEQFSQEFIELVRDIEGEEAGAALTRSLPTFFLMLGNPDGEIFIRSRLFNRLSKSLTGKPLFGSDPLDAESYRRASDFARSVKAILEEWGWKPVDMIDVQGFLWVAGAREFPTSTAAWIFQANPDIYDIEGALRGGQTFRHLQRLAAPRADSSGRPGLLLGFGKRLWDRRHRHRRRTTERAVTCRLGTPVLPR